MTFLNPGLLPLLLFALLPILVHLLNRLRYRRVRWAAMDFLLESRRDTVRRSRLKNFLLLAARCLALSLLVIALARPVATSGLLASVFVGGAGNRLILVDNTLSMGLVRRGETSLEKAMEVMKSILSVSAQSARLRCAALVQPSDRIEYLPPGDSFAENLPDLFPQTHGGCDMAAALKSAASELSSMGKGDGEIIVLTDLQRSNWNPEDARAWGETREELLRFGEIVSLRIVDVGSEEWDNAAVAGIYVPGSIFVAGERPRIRVELMRSSRGPDTSVVSLFVDDGKKASAVVEWDRDGTAASTTFETEVGTAAAGGRAELAGDALSGDNARYFVLEPCTGIPVLCLDGRPSGSLLDGAAGFIAAALDPDPDSDIVPNPIAVSVKRASSTGYVLGDYAVVLAASVPSFSESFLKELHTFVERGGLLVVFAGEGCDPGSYARGVDMGLFPARLLSVRSSEDEDGVPIASVDYTVPALEAFDSPDNPQIQDVRVWRWWKVELADAGAGELLGLEDGSPWLVAKTLGAGRVLFFASPCDARWSTMAVSPSFLPLMHRLILGFVGGKLPQNMLTVGEAMAPSRVGPEGAEFEVAFPGGGTAVYRIGAGAGVCRETLVSGIYRLTLRPGETEQLYAVNPSPEESSGDRMTEDEIRGLLREVPVALVRAGDSGGGMAGSKEGWPLAAAAVLLFLAAEVFIAATIDRSA